MAKNFIPIFNPISANVLKLKFSGTDAFELNYTEDYPVGVSQFGTLVFDNLVIPPSSWTNNQNETIPYAGIEINGIYMEASQEKNIITTEIQGREGAVKEYISSNDTSITIYGQLTGFANLYPTQEVNRLRAILAIPQQIEVRSKFINDVLGFKWIVITGWNLPQIAGQRDTQPFTINAVNDISGTLDQITGKPKPSTG